MEHLLQDFQFAARTLRKQPVFTVVAILTLAVGIGANTAIFSLIRTLILKPPAIAGTDRVVTIWRTAKGKRAESATSYLEVQDWRALTHSFESIAAYKPISIVLQNDGRAERLQSLRVTANFLSFMKVTLLRGRDFTLEEERLGAEPVAILSYEFWRSRFGADDKALGMKLDLDGQLTTIVGVLPRSFVFPLARQVDVLTTVSPEDINLGERGADMLLAVGRLKPGITREQAQSDLAQAADSLERQYPEYDQNTTAYVVPLAEQIVGSDLRRALWLLLGTVAFILLIACTNVTNLLLVRASGRRKELALRAALGAGRWQITRELLAESLLLSALAAGVGLLVTSWALGAIKYYGRTQLPRIDEVSVDGMVLLFTVATSVLTAVLFSLLPALKAATPHLNEVLKSDSRGSSGDGSVRLWRDSLVVGEVAMGFVLLMGAGLMLRSFSHLVNVNPGFDPTNVLLSRVTMRPKAYDEHDARVRYINEALHRLQSLPGIESAAFVAPLPFTGANVGSDFRIEGDPEPEPGHAPGAYNRTVTPNYFEALKIPLKRGRYFSDQDRRGEVGAAIVNETFVRTILPNRDPLGVRLTQIGAQNKGDPEKWEIVGVVGDVHHLSLSQSAAPELYLPYQQNSWNWGHIIVRTSQRPALMTRIFTDTLQGIDPGVLIWGVTPLEAAIDGTTAQPRFYTLLFSLFGATGLFLTLTGIYSVISFTVSQRMREVGIRIALGAESLDVLRLICGRGMFLAIAGTTIGAIFAAVLTRGMANLLFELQPGDLPTFVIVALILLTAALPACWLPARRATKADPTLALRDEL